MAKASGSSLGDKSLSLLVPGSKNWRGVGGGYFLLMKTASDLFPPKSMRGEGD